MDPVNKVIAAILNNDLSGGNISAGRRRRSKSRGGESIMHSFQRRVSGGLSGGGFVDSPAAVPSVPSAPSVPTSEPVATSAPSGGRRRRSGSSRSPMRSVIKRTHNAVMKRYDEIRRSRPSMPGNEALKMAMRSVKGKRM